MTNRALLLTAIAAGCSRPAPVAAAPPARAGALTLTVDGLAGAELPAPVTVASLTGRIPGYTAQASVEWFESSSDDAVPVICLVRRGGACDVVLFTSAGGAIERIRVLDPAIAGPGGVTVGAPYREIAAAVTGCQVSDGIARGMTCGLRGAANIEAWFELGDEVPLDVAEVAPSPAILDVARVTHLWWWHPGT